MIKLFLVFLLSFLFCYNGFSQDNYDAAIQKAKKSLHDSNYSSAIKLYNAAKAFKPSQSAVVDKKIDSAFDLILQQKLEAIKNRDMALAETERANSLKIIADANLIIANNALKISHANQIMYEAQGVVKLDPMLAMHLATTALNIITHTKMDSSSIDDSLLIVDKANRIYYENNFGETIIGDQQKPDSLGKFTNAIFWPDENFIWTTTDKLYAIKWSRGKLDKKIKLDSAYQQYTFKVLGKDSLLLYGIDRGTATRKKNIKVWVITNAKTDFPVYADSSDNRSFIAAPDTISLKANRDETEGWAKRVFDFEDRVFQFNSDGKLMLIDSVGKGIRNIAFSPDGQLIAIVNADKALKTFDMHGTLKNSNINIGDFPDKLEFSPDNNVLLVKQSNSIQLFKVSNLNASQKSLNFFPSKLQSYQFSSDGRWLLVSTLSGNQQVINLYLNNSGSFELYAQFKCPGSAQTSAVFSKNNNEILSSSDKIRLWQRPTESSLPVIVDTKSEFISSVQFDSVQYNPDTTFTCVTFNNRILKYNYLNGSAKNMDSAFGNQQPGLNTTRLAAALPNRKILIVSEDGQLQLYSLKDKLEEFLVNFDFDKFTEDQKKRYGISNQ